MRWAQALLANGDLDGARAASSSALEINERWPLFGRRAELWFTRYRVLRALGEADAADALALGRAWVERVARESVPGPFRAGYVTENPLNRAILAAAAYAAALLPGADSGSAVR